MYVYVWCAHYCKWRAITVTRVLGKHTEREEDNFSSNVSSEEKPFDRAFISSCNITISVAAHGANNSVLSSPNRKPFTYTRFISRFINFLLFFIDYFHRVYDVSDLDQYRMILPKF